jgi:hypothetical protein
LPDKTPYKLNLKPDTMDALERLLCMRVQEAVAGAQDRNDQLQTWRDQLEGLGVTAANKQWSNACNICDPISMEAFLTILSQLVGALHRDPKVAVEAFSKEDEEGAKVLESWLSMESSKSDIDARLYDLAYNACRDPAVVGYVGWKQVTRISREVGYKRPGSGRVLSEEEKEDNEEYEEVPYQEEVTEEAYDIRPVDLANFYLCPPDAVSVSRATAVAERMNLTEEELYDGIGDYGYDEDAVEKLCRLGPAPINSDREIQNSQDGVDSAVTKDGYYEIFTVYTRLPRTVIDEDDMPDYLMQDDFLVVCAPYQGVILKIAFSPFKERPYFLGGILPKPNKAQGHSLMAMLEGLQSEANANIQLTIDAMNLTMCPVLLVPDSEADAFNKQKIQPAATIRCNDPKGVLPLPWDKAPLRDGLAWQTDIRNRSKALVSAEGQGQLQSKVRKQGEIDNLQQQTSAKFGMYLSNFQRTVVTELYRRIVSLKLQFGDVDDDGEEFSDAEGRSHKLTARALRGKYNIVASGTSLTHSPEARVEVGAHKQKVQSEYLIAASKLPPNLSKLAWHGARELLFDLGERNPEAWIGEEPQEQPQAPQAPQNGPQGQQMALPQNGTGQQPQMQLGANN